MADPNGANNDKRRALILVLVLLVALAALVWWAFAQTTEPDPTVSPTPGVTQTVTATPTGDASPSPSPTIPADWQTYTNEQFDFRFSYPPSWEVTTGTQEGVAVLTNFNYPQQPGRELTSEQVKAVFRVEDNPNNLTAREWESRNRGQGTELVSLNDVQVASEPAVKAQVRTQLGTIAHNVFIPHAGRMYIITWHNPSDDRLDAILNTFRFI